MKSIKTKLIIFSTILVITVTLVIGLISITIGRNTIKEQAKYSLMLLAGESAKLTQSRVDAMVSALTMISKKTQITEMGWEVNLNVLSEELAKTNFIDIGYVLPNGYTYFTDGTVSLMSDRAYVEEALAGHTSISDVIISRVTRKPEFEAAAPVYGNGLVVGAVIARMKADYLSEITKDIGYGGKGYAFMMNHIGTIIAHPDTQKVIDRFNPVKEGADSAYQQILTEKNGVISYQEEGRTLYAGFAPIEGTDWSFVITADQEEVMAAIPKMLRSIILVMFLVVAISLVAVYLVERRITGPLIALTKHSKLISNLDISKNIDVEYLLQRDEIGTLSEAFQNLIVKLRDTITSISASAVEVSDTALRLTATSQQSALVSDEISRTVEDIARGAMEQANHTEEGLTHASVLEIKLQSNHECMQELNQATSQVMGLVSKGLNGIDRLDRLTKENDQATRNTCDRMLTMKQNSSQIREASRIISEIAKNTNLIALNASIEAARAGDAGLGFAVVAREIQTMADQSADSAKYIEVMVNGLLQSIEQAVDSMNSILVTSKEQSKSVADTIDRYHTISQAMNKSEIAVQKLNNSEIEMKSVNQEIKLMLQSLSAIAEQNAAGTEQTASSMEEQSASVQVLADICEHLSGLAETLRSAVSRFIL